MSEGMMRDYRQFVEAIAKGEGPSQVILNRSPEHASIVLESLFRYAKSKVHIITNRLSTDVYGCAGVCDAAASFLRTFRDGEISILTESAVDRATHPFLTAVDNEAADRVKINLVPEAVRMRYRYNFAVADEESYRFEENRDYMEAMIRFRDFEFGKKLENAFLGIRNLSERNW